MQKKSYKERYFNDYHIEKKPSKNRKRSRTVYVYHGAYCQWAQYDVPLDIDEQKKRKLLYAFVLLAEILCFAIAAFWRSPVNTAAGTAFSGCLSIVALLYQIIYVARFCSSKPEMKQIDAEDIHNYIRYASAVHATLLTITAILGIVTAIHAAAVLDCLLPVFLYLLSAGCSAALFLLQRRIEPMILSEE